MREIRILPNLADLDVTKQITANERTYNDSSDICISLGKFAEGIRKQMPFSRRPTLGT